MDFLTQLDPVLQMFWYVAIPVSIIFIIQTIMTFLGVDAHDGEVADFDGDLGDAEGAPFQLFSLRNLINFLLGFSWAGISLFNTFSNKIVLIVVAFIVGILFIAIFFLIITQLMKLAENNSFRIKDTIGKTGQVYINIPAQKTSVGKVQISVNGAVHELNAITEGEAISSGTIVRVVSLVDDNLLLVEKL